MKKKIYCACCLESEVIPNTSMCKECTEFNENEMGLNISDKWNDIKLELKIRDGKEFYMGTNFYLFTTDGETKKLFGDSYELTENPKLGYQLHIAKTSQGWLPLFQMSQNIRSVKDIENVYKSDLNINIIDEYNEVWGWTEFCARVLKWNGGIKGIIKQELINGEYIPISHLDYNSGYSGYSINHYYKDSEGYEFSYTDFS